MFYIDVFAYNTDHWRLLSSYSTLQIQAACLKMWSLSVSAQSWRQRTGSRRCRLSVWAPASMTSVWESLTYWLLGSSVNTQVIHTKTYTQSNMWSKGSISATLPMQIVLMGGKPVRDHVFVAAAEACCWQVKWSKEGDLSVSILSWSNGATNNNNCTVIEQSHVENNKLISLK